MLVVNEHRKEPDGLLVIHLPDGPTAHFRVSNVKITTELRKNHRDITAHRPEVVLNNFSTRLGLTVGRMLGALFHYDPEFQGQRAVTFHNQRDYIFFRHYRLVKNYKRVQFIIFCSLFSDMVLMRMVKSVGSRNLVQDLL